MTSSATSVGLVLGNSFASDVLVDLGSDFAPANICLGKTIFGRAGSASCTFLPSVSNLPTANLILSPKQLLDSSGNVLTGTMVSRGSYDLRTSFPGAGFFSAMASAPAASQICSSGETIAGTTGTATCQSATATDPAAAADVLVGKKIYTSSGTVASGSMVTQGAINLNTQPLPSPSPSEAGYYTSVSLTLSASQVCPTVNIFGSPGTANCDPPFSDFTASNVQRDRTTTTQVTLTYEKTHATYAPGYSPIPDIYTADDGSSGSSVSFAPHSFTTCGTTGTIQDRITDCSSRTGATWVGASNGNAGESTWSLVVRTASGKEVWRDARTLYLWSDTLTNGNWCQASGNAQTDSYGGICDSPMYQQQPSDGDAFSFCAEGAGLTSGLGENWTLGTYADEKGNLGMSTTPSIRWRLPSRNDFVQADLDGARYVLPNVGLAFWTATVYGFDRQKARIWSGTTGMTSYASRSDVGVSVRCVGYED